MEAVDSVEEKESPDTLVEVLAGATTLVEVRRFREKLFCTCVAAEGVE
jgi:hypothetical protein